MRPPISALLALLLLFAAPNDAHGELGRDEQAALPEGTVVGQVLLPSGEGRRGVELRVTEMATDQVPQTTWVWFDAEGQFAHAFRGRLASVICTAGSAEVHRIGAADLPDIDQSGQIDIGVIDLRDRLMRHRFLLRAAEGSPPGAVRVAMWPGPPPVGPYGEPVSLGSRQFPPIALGNEMEWLVPHEARSLYFLVERPVGPGRGRAWRSGHQRLFGPFTAENLPTELAMD